MKLALGNKEGTIPQLIIAEADTTGQTYIRVTINPCLAYGIRNRLQEDDIIDPRRPKATQRFAGNETIPSMIDERSVHT